MYTHAAPLPALGIVFMCSYNRSAVLKIVILNFYFYNIVNKHPKVKWLAWCMWIMNKINHYKEIQVKIGQTKLVAESEKVEKKINVQEK